MNTDDREVEGGHGPATKLDGSRVAGTRNSLIRAQRELRPTTKNC